MIATVTASGLHGFVAENVLPRYALPGVRAADLGTGSGSMADRLRNAGCEVTGVDCYLDSIYPAGLPHVLQDLNDRNFSCKLGCDVFDLVTAIEVIEHVESPISFLRNIGRMLSTQGVAVITTPNVDNLPARLKFLWTGRIRTMDQYGEPTHISPIFYDLLMRQFAPVANVRIREHLLFPPKGFHFSRPAVALAMKAAASLLPGKVIRGDNHVLVIEKR